MSSPAAQSPNPRTPTGWSRQIRVGILVASVAIAVVGGVIVLSSGAPSADGAIVATIKVPGHPRAAALGPDAMWVVMSLAGSPSASEASLLRVNLATGAVEGRADLAGSPGFAIGLGDDLWVSNSPDGYEQPGRLMRLDWNTGAVRSGLMLAGPAGVLTADATSVWLMLSGDRISDGATLLQVDRTNGSIVGAPTRVSDGRSIGLAFAYGAVWATAHDDGKLVRIDPATRALQAIAIGPFPVGVVAAGGRLWIADRGDGTVRRVDPASMTQVGDPIAVGKHPSFLAAAGDSIWVANQDDGTVTRIKIDTGLVTSPAIRIAPPSSSTPAAQYVVTDDGSVWVTSMSQDSLSRIDPRH